MYTLRNITYHYQDIQALNNFTLTIHPGDKLGLIDACVVLTHGRHVSSRLTAGSNPS